MAYALRALALIQLLPRPLLASSTPDAACDADATTEEAALLQSISKKSAAGANWSYSPFPVPCYAGQSTQCPGSSSQCAGNQCCPGIKWSGGKTFVCPSASSTEASNCAFPYKAWYCTAPPAGHAALPQSSTGEAALLQSRSSKSATGAILSFPMYQVSCYAGESTQCPGSSSQCAGNQCCPGIEWSGNKTFVCPSATSIEASNCAFPYKAWYCV